MMAAADETLGTGGAGYRESIEAFNAQRFAQSRPYYAAIDRATVTVNDELLDVLNKTKGVQGPTELLYGTRTGQTLDLSKLKKGDQLPMNLLDDLKQTLLIHLKACAPVKVWERRLTPMTMCASN
jgi:hypothetical protein